MEELGEWQGGKLPGGVSLYCYKGCQVGWRFLISGTAAKDIPVKARQKYFPFSRHGGDESAKAAAKDYQQKTADDYRLLIKNRYRFRIDPADELPYIEYHIKDKSGEDHYPTCDVEDFPLLVEHTWAIHRNKRNTYVATNIKIDGRMAQKYFHTLKCPDWSEVDHFSVHPDKNRNGLDNRGKHLRDGSGGLNGMNCRRRSDNKSGVNGIHYCDANRAWVVRVRTKGERSNARYFRGPEDETHQSFMDACEEQKKQAAKVGNTNGQ